MMDLERLDEAIRWYESKKPWNVRGDTTSGRNCIESLLEAARAYRDLLASKPTDDEFGELTTVLAWIDLGAIYQQNGEWVSVDGDAKLVPPTEGE